MVAYFVQLVVEKRETHPKFTYKEVHVKTLKKLKEVVKKLLEEKKYSFIVYATFDDKRWRRRMYKLAPRHVGNMSSTFFEFWEYELENDKVYNYNLRRNQYYKRLRHMERQLRPIMLRHAVK